MELNLSLDELLEYARLYHDIGDAYLAAERMFPDDVGRCSQIAVKCPNDPIVVKEVSRLNSEEGDVSAIASKYDVCKLLWDMANDGEIDAKDRILAVEKYAAVSGIYDAKAPAINNNNVVTPTVMKVTDHGDNDEWEAKLAQQQEHLKERANAKLSE